jgi:4-phospho-D-threonate 3-dehydrogenase / 4-phospho-D-erythronate 3-dehydrogenase
MASEGDTLEAHTPEAEYRPLIGITMGDPAGIGAELMVRALADPVLRNRGRFIVYALDECLTYAGDQAEITPFWYRQPHDLVGRVERGVVVADFDEYAVLPMPVRQPTRQCGEVSMRFLEEAISRAKAGHLDALITGPVSPESWQMAGFRFQSNTDKLADAFAARITRRMLIGGGLRVVLASDREALFSLWQKFGIGTVFQPIDLLNESLRKDFGIAEPRIVVCSLNPHPVGLGHFGDEENRVMEPALLMAREAGIRVDGPLPAALVFSRRNGKPLDGVVAMYYDQGAVAVHMTAPEATVVATLGLPLIHLEPDVGPSFEKAGRERVNKASLEAAVELAIEMVHHRMAVESPTIEIKV